MSRDRPRYPSHWRPRTAPGWVAVGAFLLILALAEPPVVHRWANRLEPWLLGLPFLYAYLLGVYLLLIGVLVWARRRGL